MMALSSDCRTDGLRPGIVWAAQGSSHSLPCLIRS